MAAKKVANQGRVRHGRYIGLMRFMPVKVKKQAQKLRKDEGVVAAIAYLREMRKQRQAEVA